MHDYSEAVEEVRSDVKLADLTNLARRQVELEKLVKEAEDSLKSAKEQLRQVEEFELPEMMDALGMEKFTTSEGINIEVVEKVRASIPKTRAAEAFAWLRDHNQGGVIKRELAVALGKDDSNLSEVVSFLRERELLPKVDESIHPQTLGKLVRELLESGTDFPLELFGVYRQRFSKVKF